MLFKMIIVMLLKKCFYLFGEKGEEFAGGFGFHEGSRDCDFGLLEGKGLVSMEGDGTDAEVCASKVNCEVDSLGYSQR